MLQYQIANPTYVVDRQRQSFKKSLSLKNKNQSSWRIFIYHFDARPLFNYDDGQLVTHVASTSPTDTSFCARFILPLPFVSIQSTPTADPSPSHSSLSFNSTIWKYEACGAVIDWLRGNRWYSYAKIERSGLHFYPIPEMRLYTM